MYLIDMSDGMRVDCTIDRLQPVDFSQVKKNFSFDWKKEFRLFPVYKLSSRDRIQGLISLWHAESFLLLNLIELADYNVGKLKRFDRVAATLIAFAASISLNEHDGYMVIMAKTSLINHYRDQYGFIQIGHSERMISYPRNTIKLVTLFL